MRKIRTKDDRWYNNLTNSLEPYKVECKCGKKVIVLRDKKICSHCGNYVFKSKEEEFKYRVKEKICKI